MAENGIKKWEVGIASKSYKKQDSDVLSSQILIN